MHRNVCSAIHGQHCRLACISVTASVNHLRGRVLRHARQLGSQHVRAAAEGDLQPKRHPSAITILSAFGQLSALRRSCPFLVPCMCCALQLGHALQLVHKVEQLTDEAERMMVQGTQSNSHLPYHARHCSHLSRTGGRKRCPAAQPPLQLSSLHALRCAVARTCRAPPGAMAASSAATSPRVTAGLTSRQKAANCGSSSVPRAPAAAPPASRNAARTGASAASRWSSLCRSAACAQRSVF